MKLETPYDIIKDNGDIKKVSWLEFCIYESLEILEFAIKWALLLNFAYLIFTIFLKATLPIYQNNICPILLK